MTITANMPIIVISSVRSNTFKTRFNLEFFMFRLYDTLKSITRSSLLSFISYIAEISCSGYGYTFRTRNSFFMH